MLIFSRLFQYLFGFVSFPFTLIAGMFSNDGITGGYNSDVLNAEPDTEETKQSLVEEIKNRAKGCITSRNFPEAIKLYTKAIEITTSNAPALAILHANRSMCYLGMHNNDKALDDAKVAVSTDPSYIKGYYRQAMAQSALNNFRGAREALMEGLTLKPDDKELKAALAKVETDLSKPPAAVAKAKTTYNTTTSSTTTTSSSSSKKKETSPTPVSANKPVKKTASQKAEEDSDEEDLKNLNLRGYKIDSAGRKTTFFNNELDETAKNLIGSIAPKKLEPTSIQSSSVPTAIDSTSASNTIGSAWNTAGTYEERIVTPWVEESLTSHLTNIKINVTNERVVKIDQHSVQNITGVDITVTGVENLTGHAQVTMMRGKKKHMCDFSVDVKYTLVIHLLDGKDDTIVGKANIVDITADKEYEVTGTEVTTYNTKTTTASNLPGYAGNVYNTYIRKEDNKDGLQKAIHTALMNFCDEFKTK